MRIAGGPNSVRTPAVKTRESTYSSTKQEFSDVFFFRFSKTFRKRRPKYYDLSVLGEMYGVKLLKSIGVKVRTRKKLPCVLLI